MTPARSFDVPRWLRVLLALVCMAIGVSLTLKPFDSLDALVLLLGAALIVAGLGEIPESGGEDPWPKRALGFVLIVAGIVVLVMPDVTVGLLAVVVGLGLVVGGATRLWAAVRGPVDRYVLLASGLACLGLGWVALLWPDMTILLLGLLVGPLLVLLGALQLWRVLVRRGRSISVPAGSSWGWRAIRAGVATFSLAAVMALAAVSYALNRDTPDVDSFYDTPADLPQQPGVLLRSEPVMHDVPPGTQARLILYTTTRYDGSITVASGRAIWSDAPAPAPRPVLAWTHGTTGIARRCAPSLLPESFETGAMPPALDEVLARGWAVVATDYTGLGSEGPHPYLIGRPEAWSALDAVRAARQLPGVRLADQSVVWGHSQGGGAALWVGIEAGSYAPDVKLLGVAALSPASDLLGLAGELSKNPAGTLFASLIIGAYSEVYPDVLFDDYVRATARPTIRETLERCLAGPEALISLGSTVFNDQLLSQDLTTGPLSTRLRENIPSAASGLPTLVAQGATDNLVLPSVQRSFVQQLCARSQPVDYRVYAGRDHLSVVNDDSVLLPELLAWTDARFAGEPASKSCSITNR